MKRNLLLVGGLAGWLAACAVPVEFDIVIRGGQVFDGGGDVATPVRMLDVGIRGDRIVELGDLRDRRVSRIIDATGMAVTPGFIDTGSRSGLALLLDGAGESHVRQGVTTGIVVDDANPAFWTDATADAAALARAGILFDWSGPGAFFDRLEARGTAINLGLLVPARAARDAVLPVPGAVPADAEVAAMATFVRAGLDDGALGVTAVGSGTAIRREILVALAREAGRAGKVFVADQAGGDPESALRELIDLAAEADATLVVANLRAEGPAYWGAGGRLGGLVGETQRGGQNVSGTVAPVPATDGDEALVSEDDVRALLRAGVATVGSDSAAAVWTGDGAVPTGAAGWASFPRVFGQYVRTEGLVELHEAVRRVTSLAAAQFGIRERGLVREGYFADLVVFDPERIAEAPPGAATPYPRGIAYVIVNGVVTIGPGGHTGARAGRRVAGPVGAR